MKSTKSTIIIQEGQVYLPTIDIPFTEDLTKEQFLTFPDADAFIKDKKVTIISGYWHHINVMLKDIGKIKMKVEITFSRSGKILYIMIYHDDIDLYGTNLHPKFNEEERKSIHDRWLTQSGIAVPFRFTGGIIDSEYIKRDNFAFIHIKFDNIKMS